ncbi:unnamed protein product [Caenorhabditis auriculariae]|uniref:Fe2OG dioxygenase domain-containing protein n=1 Tax=Caenorhabditis auriculariae TaxID=2777116 RepID=A0A8S1H4F2_9PELO|nr:unnamed protein product [Caenorhabditis auriculariae]
MYFSDEKERPVGSRYEGSKLLRKIHKSHEQLKRHNPDVVISEEPTQNLLNLRRFFRPLDPGCQFFVYPNKRSYSFIQCSDAYLATKIRKEFNGFVHPKLKSSHQPFVISFVKNVPEKGIAETFRPDGLAVLDNYISKDEEKTLTDFIFSHPKVKMLKHRAVLHFGHEFDYDTNSAFRETEPIPEIINDLVKKLKYDGYISAWPDQITANIYEPGHGIPSHYDTHSAFEDPVVSLSMLSDVVMEFKDGANSARIAPVLLPRRSLCLIQGESRYRWKHGIVNRKHDVDPRTNRVIPRQMRVSLTLRKIRTVPCKCPWKEFCDWDREGEMGVPKSGNEAERLEGSYVADVYENIASHFDETRHSSWKAVKKFIDDIPRGSVMYDVGCGNGKYLIAQDGLIKIGCDMCNGLCVIAAKKGCHVMRADALKLPFREKSADAVICIAVLHHIATLERRRQLVEEILRVLKPGGCACVTVWSMDQSHSEYAKMRGNKDENEAIGKGQNPGKTEDLKKNKAERLKVHDGKDFEQQDVLVPWVIDQENKTFLRYYHVFREGEAEELMHSVDGCQMVSVEKEQGNYIFVFRKS